MRTLDDLIADSGDSDNIYELTCEHTRRKYTVLIAHGHRGAEVEERIRGFSSRRDVVREES